MNLVLIDTTYFYLIVFTNISDSTRWKHPSRQNALVWTHMLPSNTTNRQGKSLITKIQGKLMNYCSKYVISFSLSLDKMVCIHVILYINIMYIKHIGYFPQTSLFSAMHGCFPLQAMSSIIIKVQTEETWKVNIVR